MSQWGMCSWGLRPDPDLVGEGRGRSLPTRSGLPLDEYEDDEATAKDNTFTRVPINIKYFKLQALYTLNKFIWHLFNIIPRGSFLYMLYFDSRILRAS